MKRAIYFFAGLLFVATLGSCDKDLKDMNNFGPSALNNGAVITAVVASSPVSDGGIVPSIIPGANRGGNRTCAEVATAFNTTFNLCGDKVDYYGYFAGSFPDGLEVTVTSGKFVEFEMTDCILIGDKYYKVGAVIVKGSNEANVYYYAGGTLGDSGLAAPENASGSPAGLSNLTFCFYECEITDVVAIKGWLMDGRHFVSDGNLLFSDIDGMWCEPLGYNMPSVTFDLVLISSPFSVIGTGSVSSSGEVTINLTQGVLDYVRLFMGTMEDLQDVDFEGSYGCPNLATWTKIRL